MKLNIYSVLKIGVIFTLVFLLTGMPNSFVLSAHAGDKNRPVSEHLLKSAETIAEHGVESDPIHLQNESLDYRLHVDDIITVSVFQEPDLSGDFRVGPNGKVSFPLVGDLLVKGLTAKEVENFLVERFSDGFLVDPKIIVRVSGLRPFYILGEVRAPGRYDYVTNMNVLNAVAIAGGFTFRANRKTVDVLRSDTARPSDVSENATPSSDYQKLSAQDRVKPGDIILVKERFF